MSLNKYQKTWLTKLRSGEYTQGIGALHKGDGSYCCLGVGYEACGGTWQKDQFRFITNDHYTMDLSDKYLEKLGIDADTQGKLINKNDQQHLTFKQIAQFLQKFWEAA